MQGTKYQVLPNFRICCRELAGLKVTSFRVMRAQFLLCHLHQIPEITYDFLYILLDKLAC